MLSARTSYFMLHLCCVVRPQDGSIVSGSALRLLVSVYINLLEALDEYQQK